MSDTGQVVEIAVIGGVAYLAYQLISGFSSTANNLANAAQQIPSVIVNAGTQAAENTGNAAVQYTPPIQIALTGIDALNQAINSFKESLGPTQQQLTSAIVNNTPAVGGFSVGGFNIGSTTLQPGSTSQYITNTGNSTTVTSTTYTGAASAPNQQVSPILYGPTVGSYSSPSNAPVYQLPSSIVTPTVSSTRMPIGENLNGSYIYA